MTHESPPWRDLSDKERYAIIDKLLITHKGMTDLFAELDYRKFYTESGATHNPPCLAILGETRAGKTRLIEEWLARNDNQRIETPTGSHIPYLYVSLPAGGSMKGTAAAFLKTLGDPNSDRGTQWNMVTRLHKLLKGCHVRMIFVDEFQHILDKETQHVLHVVSDFLKDIINQSAIPMILIGQPGQAEPILMANPQLSGRVRTPHYLKPFTWNRAQPETISEFCTLMETIDHALPFDLSGLANEEMAHRFYFASDGYLGWIMQIIRDAARLAIKTRCSTLNLALLQQAYTNEVEGTVLGHKKQKNPFASEHFA